MRIRGHGFVLTVVSNDPIHIFIINLIYAAVLFSGLIFADQHDKALYASAVLDDSFVSPDLLAYLDPLGAATKLLYDARGVSSAEQDQRCSRKGMRRLYTINAHDNVETCFWVDLHIDDACMFKNTPFGSVRNVT